jgi:hypothetical protein
MQRSLSPVLVLLTSIFNILQHEILVHTNDMSIIELFMLNELNESMTKMKIDSIWTLSYASTNVLYLLTRIYI